MKNFRKIILISTLALSSICLSSCDEFMARVRGETGKEDDGEGTNTPDDPNPQGDDNPDTPDPGGDDPVTPTPGPTDPSENPDYSYLMGNNKIKPTRDATYYAPCKGLKGADLKNALHNIIKGHTSYSYSSLNSYMLKTDVDPDNSNNIILTYQGSVSKSTSFNKEHTWAKSKGNFGETQPTGTDMHHLRPCNSNLNSTRSNFDFSEISHTSSKNVSSLSWATSDMANNYYTNGYFEPKDEFKGDIARMIFYMATRYDTGDTYDLEVGGEIPDGYRNFTSGANGKHGNFKYLYKWATSGQDPVSNFEMNRNNVIDGSYQHNRNPFIDHPEFLIMIYDESYSGPGALM